MLGCVCFGFGRVWVFLGVLGFFEVMSEGQLLVAQFPGISVLLEF